MASDGSYHLKTNCTVVDVTANLKQRRHREAIKKQSKGLIANRSAYSSNFSAWIECFKTIDEWPNDFAEGPGQAHVDAEEMQMKIEQIEKDRTEKLRQFQQEVSDRVKKVKGYKQRKELNKSLEKVEKETKVIYQSAFPKKIPTARKNTCSFRSSISADKIRNIMVGEANTDASHNIDNVLCSVQEIDQKAEEIKKQSSQARACLLAKMMDTNLSGLPGGYWGHAKPQKKSAEEDLLRACVESYVNEEVPLHCDDEQGRQPGQILNDMWKGFDTVKALKEEAAKEEAANKEAAKEEGLRADDVTNRDRVPDKRKEARRIRFNIPEAKTTPCAYSCGEESRNSASYDPGKPTENPKNVDNEKAITDPMTRPCESQIDKENKQQYWTYRKLFMDIDREKVRETQRRKNHQKNISRLKHEKEAERQKMEREVEVCIPNRDHESACRDINEVKQAKSSPKSKQSKRKMKETTRYIDALKSLLLQRVNGEDSRLPPMCSCGTTLMDTCPETCANNCVFYKNPKEFARVLSTILATMDS